MIEASLPAALLWMAEASQSIESWLVPETSLPVEPSPVAEAAVLKSLMVEAQALQPAWKRPF